ncbi:hypothetical protein LSAT2_023229 [Lamellibrachia satsuma]|nr:hypothetical protein LSAT2_023229 [Lamellibrachia satsuma]
MAYTSTSRAQQGSSANTGTHEMNQVNYEQLQELQRDRRQPVYQVISGYEHLPQIQNVINKTACNHDDTAQTEAAKIREDLKTKAANTTGTPNQLISDSLLSTTVRGSITPRTKLDMRKYSFSQRVINEWNMC